MPIPFFNSIASWILKKRIHQIELFMKYPNEVQREILTDLIDFSKRTEIGIKNEFSTIKNYRDFKNRLPIINYDDLEPKINKCREGVNNILWPTPIKWFAKSSGTTNSKSKFIPVSLESLEDCHYKGGKDMLSLYFNNNPDSNLLSGKCLRLGGSQEIYQKGNTYFGDLSAIIIDNLPIWAQFSSTPSQKTSLIPIWEKKIKGIIDESLNENVTSLAGVPSWMLVLLNKILKDTGKKNVLEIWPEIEVYFHGGINFDPYKNQYGEILNSNNFKYYEIYNASEGFFAIQDTNNSNELLLMLDYGIFYEFIPINSNKEDFESIIPLSEVKIGIKYEIIITTNGGLWRYKIGDVVIFTNLKPYRIILSGRTKNFINAFGEELMMNNAEKAISIATSKVNVNVIDYTVAPIYMDKNIKGTHEWFIEFEKPPTNMKNFIRILDSALKDENSDYEAKRHKNITMREPKVNIVPKNTFYRWLEFNDKLGGQHKIPRLSNNRDFVEDLIKLF